MNILVANLGSTSFKFRLFEMERERQVARGAIENIGQASTYEIELLDSAEDQAIRKQGTRHLVDHTAALELTLGVLDDLNFDTGENEGNLTIGFKAVHGGRFKDVHLVNEELIAEMEQLSCVAPAHNPPYAAAMRDLKRRFPDVQQVAAFETGFHTTTPREFQAYAIPDSWTEDYGVKKLGFHGASHRFIAEHMQELSPDCPRVISCHLGGSSSLCAIKNGKSLGATMGMSPQSGLPQNNRCGDFDAFALPLLMQQTKQSLEEVLRALATQSGLLGISGVSSDLREIVAAASEGNDKAQLAIDVFVAEIRRHLGGMIVRLNGVDAIVFTGGIGERSGLIRQAVCSGLDELGIVIEESLNRRMLDPSEAELEGGLQVHAATSKVEIWVVPTNEELVVARQAMSLLEK